MSNPFAGNKPLPGSGGNYLGVDQDGKPARHVVMIEKLQYKTPGFKTPQGAAIADFQILVTDTTNHKVGATYSVFHGFDKQLGKGNCVVDLAGFRSVLLGRPVQAAEVTDDMLAAAYGVDGFSLEKHDPEVFKANPGGYRGLVLVAVCNNKLTQKNTNFTVVSFQDLNESDTRALQAAHPDLFASSAAG